MIFSRRSLLVLFAAIPIAAIAEPCCGPVTAAGARLVAFLDGTGVDHLWLPGSQVNWQTGVPTGVWSNTASSHTHCSAFAASAAMRLGVYVLRPPEHHENLLANAQMGWLRSAGGAAKGWQHLSDVQAAQARANAGDLVLAAFENPDPHKSGHIAIVRPSSIDAATLLASGPFVTEAGQRNALSISLQRGFAGHHGAWVPGGGGAIAFFSHTIDWPAL
jgi:hypothetical protein